MVQAVLLFAVAFIYANLGLGGGLLFVPILLSTGVTRSDVAVPISLTFTIATAVSSVINHHRKGLVDFRLGRTLVVGALLGAVLGTLFTLLFLVDDRAFKSFFTTVLLIFGAYMLWDWVKNARDVDGDDDSKMTSPRKTSVAAATVGSGFLSGSMGIGGGLLNVPLMVYGLAAGRGRRLARHPSSSSRPRPWASGRTSRISRSARGNSHGLRTSSSSPSSSRSCSSERTSGRGGVCGLSGLDRSP